MTWICPECKKKEDLLKLNRANNISAQIEHENKKHEKRGVTISKKLGTLVLAIFILIMFVSNSNAGDVNVVELNNKAKMVIVGATSSGMAIWEKTPDYDSLLSNYQGLVSESMEKLNSDSLNQEDVLFNFYNVSLQCVLANRIADHLSKMLTPYNMIGMYTDNQDLHHKMIILVSNTVWLRQDNAVIRYGDLRFNLVKGQWYYIASETEIRQVNYDELICLVMGIDYVAPEPLEHIVVEVVSEKKRSLPGYSTVDP